MSGRFIPCKLQQKIEVICYYCTDILHIMTCKLHSTTFPPAASQKLSESTNLPLMPVLAHSDQNNAVNSSVCSQKPGMSGMTKFLWISVNHFYNITLKLKQGFMQGSKNTKGISGVLTGDVYTIINFRLADNHADRLTETELQGQSAAFRTTRRPNQRPSQNSDP